MNDDWTQCPSCGALVDVGHKPRPGDAAWCSACGEVLRIVQGERDDWEFVKDWEPQR